MLTPFFFCNLYAHLNTQGITHPQLAQAVRVPEVTIQRMFERNDGNFQTLLDISDWLQIELADLFNDRPKKRGKKIKS